MGLTAIDALANLAKLNRKWLRFFLMFLDGAFFATRHYQINQRRVDQSSTTNRSINLTN
jgi:hypothetical protein